MTSKASAVSDPFGTLAKKDERAEANEKAHPLSKYTNAQWKQQFASNNQYLNIRAHGGGCCGSKHIYYFPKYDVMWEKHIDKVLDDFIEQVPGQNYEVILPDAKCREDKGAWPKWLKRRGFRLVTVHRNTNSGNVLYVFNLATRSVKQTTISVEVSSLFPTPKGVIKTRAKKSKTV